MTEDEKVRRCPGCMAADRFIKYRIHKESDGSYTVAARCLRCYADIEEGGWTEGDSQNSALTRRRLMVAWWRQWAQSDPPAWNQ
jgi:hypothetical protein